MPSSGGGTAGTIFDISTSDLAAVAAAAKTVAHAIRQALHPEGLNLVQSNGQAASQVVPHFHFHLIPRWTGDGRGFDWKVVTGDPERIGKMADRIRAHTPAEWA